MTGLSDKMRANFTLMKQLSETLRADPQSRRNDYTEFGKLVKNSHDAQKILNDWDLDLDTSMVQVPARQITDVEVMFANRRFSTIQRGDFSRNMNAEGPLQYIFIFISFKISNVSQLIL